MERKIHRRVGKYAAITIPLKLLKKMKWEIGDRISFFEQKDKIILKKRKP